RAHVALQDSTRALEYLREALTIFREFGDRQAEASVLVFISQAEAQNGNLPEAIMNAEAALKLFEEIESPFADSVRQLLLLLRSQAGEETKPTKTKPTKAKLPKS